MGSVPVAKLVARIYADVNGDPDEIAPADPAPEAVDTDPDPEAAWPNPA